MKIQFQFGNGVVALPSAVSEYVERASGCDLRVLFALAGNPVAAADYDANRSALAQVCGCTEAELDSSVAFWRGTGIIVADGVSKTFTRAEKAEKKKKSAEKPTQSADDGESSIPETPKKKTERADELPKYTTDELTTLLEKRRDAAQLIDECQRVIGKMFNTHEVNIVLGLEDYLGLDGEYILILFDYCARIGKKSLRYIEKMAFGLFDDGVTEPSSLHERLSRLEAAATLEGEIRSLFGMKNRELTTKERKFIAKWVGDFGYGTDVIKKAYEMTIDAIHEPSPAYANAILERWNKEGLRTVEAIEAKDAEKLPGDGSFDTEDFFEAAIQRSFGDKKTGG